MKESATHLRVLFHDKGFSHSLISQISTNENWQSTLKMVAFDEISLDPDTNQSPQDLNPGHVVIGDRMITPDIDQQVYVPQPISPQLSFSAFTLWWEATVFIFGGNRYTRETLIKFLANQNGGAHVDPAYHELFDEKLDLNQGTIAGHAIQGSSLADVEHTDHIDGLAYAHLRLITQETLLSLNKAFGVPKAKEIPQMGNYPWLVHTTPKKIEDLFTTSYTITQVDDDAD